MEAEESLHAGKAHEAKGRGGKGRVKGVKTATLATNRRGRRHGLDRMRGNQQRSTLSSLFL